MDDEIDACPLCMEIFDETDRRFFACPCRYQVCLFCVDYIRREMTGLCPACRQPYDDSKFMLEDPVCDQFELEENHVPRQRLIHDPMLEEFQASKIKIESDSAGEASKSKENKTGSEINTPGAIRTGTTRSTSSTVTLSSKKGTDHTNSVNQQQPLSTSSETEESAGKGDGEDVTSTTCKTTPFFTHAEKMALSFARVVQKNVVYIMGLSKKNADETALKDDDFFGQFGEIKTISVNKTPIYQKGFGDKGKGKNRQATYCAYITFKNIDDAKAAISCFDNAWIDNAKLTCVAATTRYCSRWLSGIKCSRGDKCTFLHELDEEHVNNKGKSDVLSKGGKSKEAFRVLKGKGKSSTISSATKTQTQFQTTSTGSTGKSSSTATAASEQYSKTQKDQLLSKYATSSNSAKTQMNGTSASSTNTPPAPTVYAKKETSKSEHKSQSTTVIQNQNQSAAVNSTVQKSVTSSTDSSKTTQTSGPDPGPPPQIKPPIISSVGVWDNPIKKKQQQQTVTQSSSSSSSQAQQSTGAGTTTVLGVWDNVIPSVPPPLPEVPITDSTSGGSGTGTSISTGNAKNGSESNKVNNTSTNIKPLVVPTTAASSSSTSGSHGSTSTVNNQKASQGKKTVIKDGQSSKDEDSWECSHEWDSWEQAWSEKPAKYKEKEKTSSSTNMNDSNVTSSQQASKSQQSQKTNRSASAESKKGSTKEKEKESATASSSTTRYKEKDSKEVKKKDPTPTKTKTVKTEQNEEWSQDWDEDWNEWGSGDWWNDWYSSSTSTSKKESKKKTTAVAKEKEQQESQSQHVTETQTKPTVTNSNGSGTAVTPKVATSKEPITRSTPERGKSIEAVRKTKSTEKSTSNQNQVKYREKPTTPSANASQQSENPKKLQNKQDLEVQNPTAAGVKSKSADASTSSDKGKVVSQSAKPTTTVGSTTEKKNSVTPCQQSQTQSKTKPATELLNSIKKEREAQDAAKILKNGGYQQQGVNQNVRSSASKNEPLSQNVPLVPPPVLDKDLLKNNSQQGQINSTDSSQKQQSFLSQSGIQISGPTATSSSPTLTDTSTKNTGKTQGHDKSNTMNGTGTKNITSTTKSQSSSSTQESEESKKPVGPSVLDQLLSNSQTTTLASLKLQIPSQPPPNNIPPVFNLPPSPPPPAGLVPDKFRQQQNQNHCNTNKYSGGHSISNKNQNSYHGKNNEKSGIVHGNEYNNHNGSGASKNQNKGPSRQPGSLSYNHNAKSNTASKAMSSESLSKSPNLRGGGAVNYGAFNSTPPSLPPLPFPTGVS